MKIFLKVIAALKKVVFLQPFIVKLGLLLFVLRYELLKF